MFLLGTEAYLYEKHAINYRSSVSANNACVITTEWLLHNNALLYGLRSLHARGKWWCGLSFDAPVVGRYGHKTAYVLNTQLAKLPADITPVPFLPMFPRRGWLSVFRDDHNLLPHLLAL